MKKFIKDFTTEEKDKICDYHKQQDEKCSGCPLNPLCRYTVFSVVGGEPMGNPNFNVIEVDDEILK